VKIGIGVTTTGKRDVRFDRYVGLSRAAQAGHQVEIFVHVDELREGPAKAKNKTIKMLYDAGCDVMFFFDDDCYPMHEGWDSYVIQHHLSSNCQFFGLPESFKSNLRLAEPPSEVTWWDGVIGCFIFHTREVVNQIGYYNSDYSGYGYEDAARNDRIRRRFFPGPNYPSLLRLPSYIFSEDVYARNPTPNLTMQEKLQFIERNGPIFSKEMHSAELYHPFG